MPNKKLVRSNEFPYHLRGRTNNRIAFPGDLRFIWKTITGELFLQVVLHEVRIHAFVLMPNHFHLLATCPKRPVDQVVRDVISSSTRIINSKNQQTGHLFGGRYGWSLIQEPDYYFNVYKYVLRNPVKAGLCEAVGDFPFSTYAGQIGEVPLPFPVFDPRWSLGRLMPDDFEHRDLWLNTAHRREENDAIKCGLRRKEFKVPLDRTSRKKTTLDN